MRTVLDDKVCVGACSSQHEQLMSPTSISAVHTEFKFHLNLISLFAREVNFKEFNATASKVPSKSLYLNKDTKLK